MIEIRPAETDADLEAWRQVRIAVRPNERAASIEKMRRAETPEQIMLLAALEGEIAGCGVSGRSDLDRDVEQVREIGGEAWPEVPDARWPTARSSAAPACSRTMTGPTALRTASPPCGATGAGAGLPRRSSGGRSPGPPRPAYTSSTPGAQRGNEGMRAVNEKLGYVTRRISIRVRGSLPLPP